MNKTLLVIDSNYVCYISKFAYSQGLDYKGSPTEILFGVLKTIIDLSSRFETNRFAFCFDSKQSKRMNMFPKYKWKRKQDKSEAMEENDKIAYRQFDQLRLEVLPKLGFSNIFMQDGYESDDLIASIVRDNVFKEDNTSIIVVSSDSDLYQLLGGCSIYNLTKKETMTKHIFTRTYGIRPCEWVNVMELSGCNTDNVPGIEGVGKKKAIAYLKGELTKGKVFDRIRTCDAKDIDFTRELVELPFPGTMQCRLEKEYFSTRQYKDVCAHYGFKSLLTENKIDAWRKQFCGGVSHE
jgi:DNA polymerase-1